MKSRMKEYMENKMETGGYVGPCRDYTGLEIYQSPLEVWSGYNIQGIQKHNSGSSPYKTLQISGVRVIFHFLFI